MKNTVEGINSRLDDAEDQISDLEDKVSENTWLQQQKKKRIKKKDSLGDLCGNMKHNHICTMGVPKGEEREQESKAHLLKKIITENFPNLLKEKDPQAQEVQSPKQGKPKGAHTKTHHN